MTFALVKIGKSWVEMDVPINKIIAFPKDASDAAALAEHLSAINELVERYFRPAIACAVETFCRQVKE